MVNNRADVNAVDDAGKTSLHVLAKKCRRPEDVKHLTCLMTLTRCAKGSGSGLDMDKRDKVNGWTPLDIAVRDTGNWDVVRALAEAGADVAAARSDICRVFGEAAYNKLVAACAGGDPGLTVVKGTRSRPGQTERASSCFPNI